LVLIVYFGEAVGSASKGLLTRSGDGRGQQLLDRNGENSCAAFWIKVKERPAKEFSGYISPSLVEGVLLIDQAADDPLVKEDDVVGDGGVNESVKEAVWISLEADFDAVDNRDPEALDDDLHVDGLSLWGAINNGEADLIPVFGWIVLFGASPIVGGCGKLEDRFFGEAVLKRIVIDSNPIQERWAAFARGVDEFEGALDSKGEDEPFGFFSVHENN